MTLEVEYDSYSIWGDDGYLFNCCVSHLLSLLDKNMKAPQTIHAIRLPPTIPELCVMELPTTARYAPQKLIL